MNDKVFIDSNIWLYALIEEQSSDDAFKHTLSKNLFLESDDIQISTQVVNEVAINLMRKTNKDNDYIFTFIHDLVSTYTVHHQTSAELITAATLRLNYSLSYWDSLIVASAINHECTVLYSEDMQDGLLVHDSLKIINPFKA
ncbi:MAG: PIN domain-containing protein [Cocleimonas sp.]